MAEFDEKLNNILSNPEAMSQIMQLAQSLGGPAASPPAQQPAQAPPPPSGGGGDLLSSLAGGLDAGAPTGAAVPSGEEIPVGLGGLSHV